MDLLYTRYANPMEFMRLYIDQGRFGELVGAVLWAENRRREEQAEREQERRLWAAYVHSHSGKSFRDWKAAVLIPQEPGQQSPRRDEDMTKEDLDRLMAHLFPSTGGGRAASRLRYEPHANTVGIAPGNGTLRSRGR